MRLPHVATRLRRWFGLLLLVAAAAAVAIALRRTPPSEVAAALSGLSLPALGLAAGLTAICYALLVGYDLLAWRHLGRTRPPLAETARASFVGYGLSHTLGASLVTGGLARDRLHARSRVRGTDIAAVVAFCAGTSFLGYLALTGLALAAWPDAAAAHGLSRPAAHAGAILTLGLVGAYLAACGLLRRPLRVRGREISLPAPHLALAQVALGTLEWTVAALALAPLLPAGFGTGPLLVAFALAKTAAFFVHTPGGVGVFEAALLALAPTTAAPPGVLAALLAYRAIHYLLPFALAAALLGAHEWRGLRRRTRAHDPAS